MQNGKAKPAGQVRSLTRGLTLLRHIAGSAAGLSLTEISEATGLPPSTTHRLLTTLEAERFVRYDGQGGGWCIGVAAFYVGSAFARSRDRYNLARPYLRRLMEISGETANLFVESDGEAVCIGQVESRHAMRAITGVGGRVVLHASAAGKALLAFLDAPIRERLLATMPFDRSTASTITERDRFRAQLEEIRGRGYATDDEEHAVGLRCVAAPILNEFGQADSAISISGPSTRIPIERLAVLGRMVVKAACEATRDLGGDPSASVVQVAG